VLSYQASPIVVAMGMDRVPARDGLRLCLALAAITFVVLMPLDYGWFELLGQFRCRAVNSNKAVMARDRHQFTVNHLFRRAGEVTSTAMIKSAHLVQICWWRSF